MARIFVTDPGISDLVARLADVFVRERSVNAVQRALTQALAAAGHAEKIYPNRLHALLSSDATRSVNEETIRVLRLALDAYALSQSNALAGDQARPRPSKQVAAAADELVQGLAQAGETAQIPPAVARYLRGASAPTSLGTSVAEAQHPPLPKAPDWSYQDDACHKAIRAIKRAGRRKIGLVLPTGAGKTRVAMRIVLRVLDDEARDDTVVLWVTHRRFLAAQANRELQRAIQEGTPDLPEKAVRLLRTRVEFLMVSQLQDRMAQLGDRIALIVVDEAHHAAAPSYQALFSEPGQRGLFLTATPNRTDQQAIGIDEIAYTTTYRDLFSRGVLIEPSFEPPIPALDVRDETTYEDLADYLIERSADEFVKTIVIVARVDGVERLYEHLLDRLDGESDHLLQTEDIGFAHGAGTSAGNDVLSILDEFASRERGILVSTAQLLGEGFDDPKINAVVLTYGTSSMGQLMQVAGRCLRYAPGKSRAYVVQATSSDLPYHFEQRWLYQDIADRLHPIIRDDEYRSLAELRQKVERLLSAHRVAAEVSQTVLRRLDRLEGGQEFTVLLSGLPYDGEAKAFETDATWSAVPVAPEDRERFLTIFNEFSDSIHEDGEATVFLRRHLEVDPRDGSEWSLYRTLLYSMMYAWKEIQGEAYWRHTQRPYSQAQGTSWLTYVTFRQGGTLPPALETFLGDATNRHALSEQFLADPEPWAACVKIDLPIGGTLAFLLGEEQWAWVEHARSALLEGLKACKPEAMHGWVEGWKLSARLGPALPAQLLHRLDSLVSPEATGRLTLGLTSGSPAHS